MGGEDCCTANFAANIVKLNTSLVLMISYVFLRVEEGQVISI